MLKSLLQLLLETFIKSKREWIAHQSAPLQGYEITLVENEVGYYTAPYDGWLMVNAKTVNLQGKVGSMVYVPDDSVQDIMSFIPMSKGEMCTYWNRGTKLARFVKTVGSA